MRSLFQSPSHLFELLCIGNTKGASAQDRTKDEQILPLSGLPRSDFLSFSITGRPRRSRFLSLQTVYILDLRAPAVANSLRRTSAFLPNFIRNQMRPTCRLPWSARQDFQVVSRSRTAFCTSLPSPIRKSKRLSEPRAQL